MDPAEETGAETHAADPVDAPEEPSAPRLPATERLRLRLTDSMTRAAPYVVAIDGMLVIVAGASAVIASTSAFQGEGFLLLVAGLALILFGSMMILRWNLSVVRFGLFGLTAGYFASALQEFQVATDPCDIGATLERCATHVPGGLPWVVYQGPLILAVLLFVFIVFEPLLTSPSPPQSRDQ